MIYWQDTRSTEKMITDYKYWKKAEWLIMKRLEDYFWIEATNDTDKEWEFENYTEDALMWYWDLEWKIEIKYTKKELNYVEWKLNQYNYAKENNVNLLQVSWKRIAFIKPTQKWYYREKWYCNKEVMSFKVKWYNSFEELRQFLIR